MTIFEHWQQQKENLQLQISRSASMADAVYQIRHAIVQTEQNALAEMSDDTLRQQAGVLMGSIKGAIGLLEVPKAAVGAAALPKKSRKLDRGQTSLALIAAVLLAGLAVCCYWKGWVLGTVLALCALLIGGAAVLWKPSPVEEPAEPLVTLRLDTDRLFVMLDGQMRSIDRCLNDFSYLNEQLACGADPADEAAISRAADLMEALYEYGEAERAPAEEAARRLLAALGFCALSYSEENSRLFNILPSKNVTCTLSPAIVSAQDHRLLRRGTAAVQTAA